MSNYTTAPPGTRGHLVRVTEAIPGDDVRTIVVNGRSHDFAGHEIGVRDLATIAWPNSGDREHSSLTVAYDGGPIQAPSGLLPANGTTPVANGQVFSVSLTDKS